MEERKGRKQDMERVKPKKEVNWGNKERGK